MSRWLGVCALLGIAVWAYRTFGWIRQPEPLSATKRKSDIFTPTAPRYRRTQPGKPKASVTAIDAHRRKSA